MKEFEIKINSTLYYCTCYEEDERKLADIDLKDETEKLLKICFEYVDVRDTELYVIVAITDDKHVVLEEVCS